MATKKKVKGKHKQSKPHGHFCYVCGEHKANEKFSGHGHAHHICRQCQKLPADVRNEMAAIRKIWNMPFRHLNQTEINWLRERMKDARPDVRAAAIDAHSMKFPYYERNKLKKNLTARSLEFYINGGVYDESYDERSAHMRFYADYSGTLRRLDYDAPEDGQETVINIGQQSAQKFLKAVVHSKVA